MLIDAEAFKIFSERGLDSLIESGEVWSGILLDLAFETVQLLDLVDVIGDLHAVKVDLSVDSGSLNHQAFVISGIRHENREVAVVFGLGATLFIFTVLLIVRKLLIIWDRLSVNTHKNSARRAN